jgi:hypothetical protein
MKKPPLSPEHQPGSFGFHELLDRSCLVADLFSREIAELPAAQHPKLAARIKRIGHDLYDLYQKIANLVP